MTFPDDARPTRAEISAAADPLGWRLILGVLISHVPVSSLAEAADVGKAAVMAAGEHGDGRLSIDLLADRVVLRLHTVSVGAVTGVDLNLATAITDELDGRTAPGDMSVVPQTLEIAIDALDIPLIRPFWQAVTGYVDEPGRPESQGAELIDPLRRGPTIWFQQMDEPRSQRNRIHLDVDVPPEHAQNRIDAALAAGGVLRHAGAAPAFWVLADAEGNEVCVCTWQGRD